MRTRYPYALRLALTAVAVGASAHALARFAATSSGLASFEGADPWRGAAGLPDLAGTLVSALAVLVPVWILRRSLSSLTFVATFPTAVLAVFLYAFCLSAGAMTAFSLLGGGVEELHGLHGMERFFVPPLCVLIGSVYVLTFVARTFYASLPLAWLGVWLLWRASRGLTSPEHLTLSVP